MTAFALNEGFFRTIETVDGWEEMDKAFNKYLKNDLREERLNGIINQVLSIFKGNNGNQKDDVIDFMESVLSGSDYKKMIKKICDREDFRSALGK